jgi:hypothetical protein
MAVLPRATDASPPPTSPRNGLSTGAIAGVAVGTISAVWVLVLAAYILFMRPHKRESSCLHSIPDPILPETRTEQLERTVASLEESVSGPRTWRAGSASLYNKHIATEQILGTDKRTLLDTLPNYDGMYS